ncbi:hypothetical protein U1Q18_018463 [Sarracenia purpurea var. burkii]
MQPQQSSRIDVADLKAQIVKKLGPERSKRYFYYVNGLLSQKLRKVEFDRLCFRVLGRENVPVHNLFVRSILKNACLAKTRPPVHDVGITKSAGSGKSSTIGDGHEQSRLVVPNQTPSALIWSNGIVLPMPSRKGRSAIRDRKLRDRPSPLGPNGKTDNASHQSTPAEEDSDMKLVVENGHLVPCDYERPLQHVQGLAEQSVNGRPGVKNSTDSPFSFQSKDQTEAAVVEDDGEEVEQASHLNMCRSPLLAPFGIPFCSASVGGARKALPSASSSSVFSYCDSRGLSDTDILRKRMEYIALAQGLGGVSMECANVLNNMLDVYLKRLIRSCVELVYGLKKKPEHKHQIQSKVTNGMWASSHHMQSTGSPQEIMQEHRPCCSISLIDFKVAMELNPQQLGEDWPLMLEKICVNAFEE